MESNKRYNNYDLLKILSSVSVVIIHANWYLFGDKYLNPTCNYIWKTQAILNIVTRFSVPSFLMISGAFAFCRLNEKPFLYFKRMWKKVFFPWTVCMVVFVTLKILKNAVNKSFLFDGVEPVITGHYYNMWYFYMLAGICLIAPFIMIIKENISFKGYILLTVFLTVWAVISQATSYEKTSYSIGVCFSYVSYYMLGSVLFELNNKIRRCNIYFIRLFAILISMVCIIFSYYFRYAGNNYYTFEAVVAFFSPCVLVYSLAVFVFVGTLDINCDLSWLSKKNLYIYIFHTGVMKVIILVMPRIENDLVYEFAIILTTCFFAVVLAVIFDLVWNNIALFKNITKTKAIYHRSNNIV